MSSFPRFKVLGGDGANAPLPPAPALDEWLVVEQPGLYSVRIGPDGRPMAELVRAIGGRRSASLPPTIAVAARRLAEVLDRVRVLNAQCDALHRAGDTAAADELELGVFQDASDALELADRKLAEAFQAEGLAAATVDGRLYVSTWEAVDSDQDAYTTCCHVFEGRRVIGL